MGLNFPTDGITISTVGPVNQLKKLREEHLKFSDAYMQQHRLQKLYHSSYAHTPLKMLLSKHCPIHKGIIEKWYFAYLLLPGINDRSSDISTRKMV